MNKLFIASKNKGKIEEIKYCLKDLGIEIFSFLDHPGIPEIEETGNSFEENAILKAKVVYRIVNIPVIADDSGLEVDFLNGAPGIYSARFAGGNQSDKQNNDKLLGLLKGVELSKRTARFKCVLALYDGVSERFFDGICEGHITFQPRGEHGFGYDPVFIPIGYNETFGELGYEIKNRISHRSKAINSFKKFIEFERNM